MLYAFGSEMEFARHYLLELRGRVLPHPPMMDFEIDHLTRRSAMVVPLSGGAEMGFSDLLTEIRDCRMDFFHDAW